MALPGVMGLPFGNHPLNAIGVGMLSPAAMLNQNKNMMPQSILGGMGGMGGNGIPQMGGMMNVAPQAPEGNPKTKLEQTIRDK